MSCTISQDIINQTIAFHGHSCPGLAIGIRAAEMAEKKMGKIHQNDLVCVAETDMCGVDAIQFLTGCTVGKGNLILKDYGKMAFSFYNRRDGSGIRLVFNNSARGTMNEELTDLMDRGNRGLLSADEQARLGQMRSEMQQRLMTLPVEEVFTAQPLTDRPPRGARVLASLECADCGERTMESRTRRFAGQTLCIPCYQKVEQKI
ncbi:MAG: formylmethanofuran dehydrogenase [Desulfobulbaceae bacterium]|nr:formylmethanofuran dehydrogenase [Desulfobulbaceae bacterium]